MARLLRHKPPIRRPGAGKGEHFSVNDPRSSRGNRPPEDVIAAVMRVMEKASGSIEQREIARRLQRELGRKLDQASYAPYTSQALGRLLDDGRVEKVGEHPAEWRMKR